MPRWRSRPILWTPSSARGPRPRRRQARDDQQNKVTVSQGANRQEIEIQPASPEIVYVPYYDPAVVYGAWPTLTIRPTTIRRDTGYVVGGAIATGLAWGAAFAIGHQIWDNFDWDRGNINVTSTGT